ncbi:MAG TPA: YceD family protein [Acetobacteraceae bacterium]|nr:YceD family protein [Acetobacteraceae bacterium]
MAPEFSRPVAAESIGEAETPRTVEANPGECAALAIRFGLPAIEHLACRFGLRRTVDGAIAARGELEARIVQTCVVSLEPFAAVVAERFHLRFVPAGTETDAIDPDAEDEVPCADGVIDLGEAAAEQLALALDPYPRRPDAALPEAADAPAPHPFASLAAWKPRG